MITDSVQDPQWCHHLPNDGSKIGGNVPTKYGVVSPVPSGSGALIYIEGPAYSDFEAYIVRPVLPNTGSLALTFSLATDANAPKVAQAIETDTILTVNGWTYNLSAQINYEEDGMLQVADAAGAWIDTGAKPGKLAPNVPHRYSIEYSFDEAAHMAQVVSVTIDGTVYGNLPAATPATQKGWTSGAIFQVQLDLGASGGAYSVEGSDVSYVWQ